MSRRDRWNGYPARRGRRHGQLDAHQRLVNEAYRDLIRYTIRMNPWLNVSKLTDKVLESRDAWSRSTDQFPDNIKSKILRGKPTRKTVGKHLQGMLELSEVERDSGRYVQTWMRLPEVSAHFNQSAHKILSGNLQDKWNIPHADNVAACYFSSDPEHSHERFDDLLHLQFTRFRDSLLWLDDILERAMVNGCLSQRVYSKVRNKIYMNVLEQGWKKYFGDNQLFVYSVAISPPKFLEFLSTRVGYAMATEHLRENWEHILEEVAEKRQQLKHEKTRQLNKGRTKA